jgi:hypothetical protein
MEDGMELGEIEVRKCGKLYEIRVGTLEIRSGEISAERLFTGIGLLAESLCYLEAEI